MRPPDETLSDYIVAMGGKKAAIVVAVVIAALSLGALVWIRSQPEDLTKSLANQRAENPFYIEGTVTVLAPADSPTAPRPEQSKSSLQWWYEGPGLWHWQIDTTSNDEVVTTMSVADGHFAYVYSSDSNTYTRVAVKKYVAEDPPVDFILGAVDVNQLVANWEAQNTTVRNGGNSPYMGRDAQVLEYSPTWRSTGAGGDKQGGIGRIWVDSETDIVLRNLVDGGPTSTYTDARVTTLQLNPRYDAAVFRFDPPNGATLVK